MKTSSTRRSAKKAKKSADRSSPKTISKSEVQAPRSHVFPIVGVGASAGGLEAFIELLKNLPSKPGMAFVLVPHLDPTHESAMTALLGRATRLPVAQVEHGMTVLPDQVYIIPPGREMTIKDGVLQLTNRPQQQAMPIDVFLRSLAEERRNNAVGVILSGTASDGTLGLNAIKCEGGITFAQDSATAKYDGMPNSAIASGAVDFILPPARIAEELVRIRHHPYVISSQEDDEKVEAIGGGDHDVAQLLRILKQLRKVDFSDYKPATLRRRILRRMALKRIHELKDYITFVREHQGEADALYEDILINVTSFFRNPSVFEALKETVYPKLLKERMQNDSIRIWVPGCSTGEEAYSHAISIVEYLADTRAEYSVQVFGTDLSESAIKKARVGIYKENITADVSATRLRRFFNKVDSGYQISKPIRDMCVFARQNIFTDPPFSRMDIVSCRNLLIYLSPVLQKRVVPVFHYALRGEGFLILGNTEGLFGVGSGLFEQVDKKSKIYMKRPGPSPINFGFSMTELEAVGAEAREREFKEMEGAKPQADFHREADRLLLSKYVPASVVVNDALDILQTRGHTGGYLELAPGKASLNLLRLARPGLLFELQKAIDEVRKTSASLVREMVQVENDGEMRTVNLEVMPLRVSGTSQQAFLIIFHELAKSAVEVPAMPSVLGPAEAESVRDQQIVQLKQELAATKDYLQSIIEEREATNEELQSANEEIQSGNEELQSTNEELQTSKEELESANEELNTVNEEMQHRNQQLTQLNNDLANLLNSVNLTIVMLGPDLVVRRFTLEAERVLGLSSVDVGRPVTHLRMKIDIPELEQMSLDVIADAMPRQKEFRNAHGSWFNLRLTPYRTTDNKIDGVVLALLDITTLKQFQRRRVSDARKIRATRAN